MAISGSTLTVAFSFCCGFLLIALTFLTGWLSEIYKGFSFIYYLWLILPVASYVISLILNSAIQGLSCNKVNIQQTLINSLFTPVFVVAYLLISWLRAFRGPVEGILPITLTVNIQEKISYGFFMFWAGMLGQGLSSGFSQSCPS